MTVGRSLTDVQAADEGVADDGWAAAVLATAAGAAGAAAAATVSVGIGDAGGYSHQL